jgi:hypothetical protein
MYFVLKRQGGELWQRLAGKKDTITVRVRTTEKAFKVNVKKLNNILEDKFLSSHLLHKSLILNYLFFQNITQSNKIYLAFNSSFFIN